MNKEQVLKRIQDTGIIAVVRADSPEKSLKIADAVSKGGIDVIEVAMTVPFALDVIATLAKAYPGKEVLVGAGTVLDSETARAVIIAGAEYVISPHVNPEVIRICNRYQKVSIPGAMTVTEIVTALEAGADAVKVFPGEVLGPAFIKAVKGPLPYARLIPTGGVSLQNLEQWLVAGCMAVGVGGNLTAAAKKEDYEAVTTLARQYVAKIKEIRQAN